MFANNKYTQKNAPFFFDSCEFEGERLAFTAVKPYIFVDEDKPPKTLINIDFLTVPIEDREKNRYHNKPYDIDGFISLVPEDAILLIRHLNSLLMEIFDEENYTRHNKRKDNHRD